LTSGWADQRPETGRVRRRRRLWPCASQCQISLQICSLLQDVWQVTVEAEIAEVGYARKVLRHAGDHGLHLQSISLDELPALLAQSPDDAPLGGQPAPRRRCSGPVTTGTMLSLVSCAMACLGGWLRVPSREQHPACLLRVRRPRWLGGRGRGCQEDRLDTAGALCFSAEFPARPSGHR
jgi:hypothetical protein